MTSGPGVETIVVGVDGSEQSAEATIPPPQFAPERRKEMQRAFEDHWCKPLKEAGVNFRAIMEDGRPASVSNDIADRVNADVIILGRRGRGGVAEMVLGSVSHELVLHSSRAVFLSPHHKGGE